MYSSRKSYKITKKTESYRWPRVHPVSEFVRCTPHAHSSRKCTSSSHLDCGQTQMSTIYVNFESQEWNSSAEHPIRKNIKICFNF